MSEENVKRDFVVSFPPLWVGYAIGVIFIVTTVGFAMMAPESLSEQGDTSAFELIATLISLTGWIYWLVCVHRIHKVLRQATNATYPISPGRAVGFHFLPLYNLYWLFKWPSEVVKFINANSSGKKMSANTPGGLIFLGVFISRILDGGIGLIMIFSALRGMIRNIKAVVQAPQGTVGTTGQVAGQ